MFGKSELAWGTLRRCWYEALISQPCLPTIDAGLPSVVGTPYTCYAAYQQRRSANYTGPVIEDSYYDWDDNLVTYKYIDYWNNPGRALSIKGNGKVGVNGVAPWKDLSVKILKTPSGNATAEFTLK